MADNWYLSSPDMRWSDIKNNPSTIPSTWGLDPYNYGGAANFGQYSTITIFGESFVSYKFIGTGPYNLENGKIYIYKDSNHCVWNNNTSYPIRSPKTNFTNAEFEYKGIIKLGSKYYQILTEIDRTDTWASLSSKSNPTKTHFQPYETIDLDGISLAFNKYTQNYSSASYGTAQNIGYENYSSWDLIKYHAQQVYGFPSNGYFDENGIGENYIDVTFYGVNFSWTITIDEFTYDYYSMQQNAGANYKIYVGKQVGSDFLQSFKICRIRRNSFNTITTTIHSSLDISKMSATIMSYDEEEFEFDYYLNSSTTISCSVSSNIHKLSSTNKYCNVLYKNSYALGEVVNLNNITQSNIGSLTYDDDTQICISDIEMNSPISISCSLGSSDEFMIDDNTPPQFTITYTLDTIYFGLLTIPFTCFVEGITEDYIERVELVDAKVNFIAGEVVDFGPNAKIRCFNYLNELIEEVPYENFNSKITSRDSRYGLSITRINGFFVDVPLNLVSYVGLKSFTHTINISYVSSFSLITTNVQQQFYFEKNAPSIVISHEGLVGKLEYHNNSNGIHEISIISKDASEMNYQIIPAIDLTKEEKVYRIGVTCNYLGNLYSSSYRITCSMIRPTRIIVSGANDSTTYYDNNLDSFHYPSGLIFNMYYNNNPSTPVQINPNTELEFFRDSNRTIVLDSTVVVSRNQGNTIYFRHKDYKDLLGEYTITFIEDRITSAVLLNNVEVVLGNSLNKYRNQFKIKVFYESNLRVDEDFQNYRFENEEIIMEENNNIRIIIDDVYFTLDPSNISFISPNIDFIEADYSTFKTAYNNNSDAIDARNIKLYVHYVGSQYVQIAENYVKNNIIHPNEFTISSAALGDYNFDGEQIIDYEMPENSVNERITLNISVKNIFDEDNSINTVIEKSISIIEITNIIGISLVKAYQNYHVGETFLNDDDDTEILLYYKDSNNENKKLKVKLNSGLSAINIFPLKGTKFYKTEKSKTIKITAATNVSVSLEYAISVESTYNYSPTKKNNLRAIFVPEFTLPNGNSIYEHYILVDDSNTQVLNGIRELRYGITLNDIEVYGYLEDVGDKTKNARVILFDDYIPPIDGESNITVQYPCFSQENSNFINKCHIGHLFGNNNAKNRLFVSGNNDYPNCDWHSGPVNTSKQEGETINENGDFTYFEDTSYCYYGQTDNKIIGYDIISNDKMVVLKSKSDKEPTIYYRTNGLIQAIDGAGNKQVGLNSETLYEESYPLVTGNIGAGALNNKSIINFNGDTLFVSSDMQIDGLDIVGIIGDSQRYANTRSKYINPLLKNEDLNSAQFFSNNKYLYLILPDCLMVTHFEKYDAETRQYEWWKLDIKNVSSMIEIDNQIYFGTIDGGFYSLENKIYKDISKVFIGVGGASLTSEGDLDNSVVVSQNVIGKLKNSDNSYFQIIPRETDYKSYMYYKIASINNIRTGDVDLFINENENCLEVAGLIDSKIDYSRVEFLRNLLTENSDYYLNQADDEHEINCDNSSPTKVYGKAYRLKAIDEYSETEKFKLIDSISKEEVDIRKLYKANLCRRMDEEYEITQIDEDNCSFKLKKGEMLLDIVRYSNQDIVKSFNAQIKNYNDLAAFYIKAPNILGNLMFQKTIWGWTLTNDTNIPSSIEICRATNDIQFEKMEKIVGIKSDDYGLTLEKFNLSNLDFNKYIIPYKCTFFRPINVPFICFGFKNEKGKNAVLCSMQILYTLPSTSIGNR